VPAVRWRCRTSSPTSFKRGGFEQKVRSWYMLMFQLRGIAEWLVSVNDFKLFGQPSGFPQEVPNWKADLGRRNASPRL
jgi:hypothetical protein